MEIAICFVFFLFLCGTITLFGYHRYVRPGRMLKQLEEYSSQTKPKDSKKAKPAMALSLLASVGELTGSSAQEISFKKRELSSAGFRADSAVTIFSGLKIASAILLCIAAFVIRSNVTTAMPKFLAPALGAAVGFMLPGLALSKLITRRQTAIRLSLADALDMLVVCCEAGCGLDQAILNVSREFKTVHPAISEEFSIVNMELLAGSSRVTALRNLATRCGEEEMKKLVAILIQTDRFGTSVADALRTQADFLRVKRRQDAEERAGKVGVKLVFPIFFFCMPSLCVVVMGPGLIQLMTNLLPAMNNMR